MEHTLIGTHIVSTGSTDGLKEFIEAGAAGSVWVGRDPTFIGNDKHGRPIRLKDAAPHHPTVGRVIAWDAGEGEPQPYLEAPQGIDEWTSVEQARAGADWFFPYFYRKWQQNPADYQIVLNEPFDIKLEDGKAELTDEQRLHIAIYLAYEVRMMELAESVGQKLCLLNMAGGTPGNIDYFIEFIVPHLRRGAEGGHAFGQHAYGGDMVGVDGSPFSAEGNTERLCEIAQLLLDLEIPIGLIGTEVAMDGGYGIRSIDEEIEQMVGYDKFCQRYPNIIFLAYYTIGSWVVIDGDSNKDVVLPELTHRHIVQHPAQRWELPELGEPVTTLHPTKAPDTIGFIDDDFGLFNFLEAHGDWDRMSEEWDEAKANGHFNYQAAHYENGGYGLAAAERPETNDGKWGAPFWVVEPEGKA